MTLLIERSQAKYGRLVCQMLAELVDLRILHVDCSRFAAYQTRIAVFFSKTLGFAVSQISFNRTYFLHVTTQSMQTEDVVD